MFRRLKDVFVLAGAFLLAGLMAFQFTGCGGSGSSGTGVVTSGATRLQVGLTDKMSDEFETVVISIKEIRVVPAGREHMPDGHSSLPVIATFETPRTVDILTLRFQQDILGTAVIPPGSYNQVRLVLAPNPTAPGAEPVNYLTLKSNPSVKIPLKTPSGHESGLKVLGRFTVQEGALNAILLDFDPNTAIVAHGHGGYILKPTGIRVVQPTSPIYNEFGSLSGTVISTFKDFSSATIAVVPQGGTTPAASGTVFSNFSSNRWEAPFTSFVPGGTYRVHVQAKGFQPYSSALQSVTVGSDTPLGNLELAPMP